MAAGRFPEAEAAARETLEIDPVFFPAEFVLGVTAAQRGALQEALEIAESVWAKAPFFLAGAGLLAGVLMKFGNVPRAEELLRKLPRDEPNQAGLYFYHLVCLDADTASEVLDAIIDRQGYIHAATFRIGQALLPSPSWTRVAKRINLHL